MAKCMAAFNLKLSWSNICYLRIEFLRYVAKQFISRKGDPIVSHCNIISKINGKIYSSI